MNKNLEKLKNSRLQLKHIFIIANVISPIISLILLSLIIYFGYWYIILPYYLYVYLDPKTKYGNESPSFNRNKNFITDTVRDYFDMKIIKSVDLPNNKNYVFGYHPHGITPFGMTSALISNTCKLDELFPGIKFNLKIHSIMFWIPILREFILYFGSQPSSKESIISTLNKPCNSIVINVGGGAEMIYCVPSSAKLVINNRFGFIKLALETGSDLVPIYSFGETSTYKQSPINQTGFSFWLRCKFYRLTNFPFPMVIGRGIFPNSKGIFPYNVPIRIVVGKPINVEKTSNPSNEQIRELHAKYCKELEALYNKYKYKFWYDSNSSPPKLEFLDNPFK